MPLDLALSVPIFSNIGYFSILVVKTLDFPDIYAILIEDETKRGQI